MTTYNTGNPLGSTDPRDLYDNAENLDHAVNSDGDTFQDRFGKSRLTWAGIERAGSGDPAIAVDAAARANDAADRAEDAGAAVASGLIAVDSAVGRAEDAADRSEDAYYAIYNSGALQSAGIYETIAAGLSGVANGEYFWVYPNSLNSIDNLTLFKRVNASTEELLYVQYNLNAFMKEEGASWEIGV